MKGQAADRETIPSNYTPVKDFYPEHIKALKPLRKGSQVPNEKEDKNWDRCFSRTVDGKEEHENYTVSHQRDANENHKEDHDSRTIISKMKSSDHPREDVEQLEPLCTASGKTKQCSHFGKQSQFIG